MCVFMFTAQTTPVHASTVHFPGLPPSTHRQPRGCPDVFVELSGASTTWLLCHQPVVGGLLLGSSVPQLSDDVS